MARSSRFVSDDILVDSRTRRQLAGTKMDRAFSWPVKFTGIQCPPSTCQIRSKKMHIHRRCLTPCSFILAGLIALVFATPSPTAPAEPDDSAKRLGITLIPAEAIGFVSVRADELRE